MPGGAGGPQGPVSLDGEVSKFLDVDDEVKRGDLGIRKTFARNVMILFAIANVFVLIALTGIFVMDCVQLRAGLVKPAERVITSQVIIALLGATTVQLGAVIYTITRAIFPGQPRHDT
jgi:hypothetical protein